METTTRTHMDDIHSLDLERQNQAFQYLMRSTEDPVPWAYDIWDELVEGLSHKDNHVRAISAQVLANLAKSDPEKRMLRDFNRLLAVTRDERFVTARHCLQSLWKVGAAGPEQRRRLVDGLETRYRECINEKNCTLIRYDIIEAMRNVYDATGDERVKEKALAWIELEKDPKYRSKYAGVWRR
ncbi:MAG TPA: hypothetical protein VIU39_13555 [Anaerolineales bacterium]